ncbi:MAG TPA: hypothetical protein VHJ20_24335 [Polyangia bacterium]|nr:hypothetical protein [Polyangia bacterium]
MKTGVAGAGWIVVVAATTLGCVPAWKPLNPASIERSKAKTIVVVLRRSPPFIGPNRNILVGGLAGGMAAMSEGQKIVETNDIDDPAENLGHDLGAPFARRYQLSLSAFEEPAAVMQRNGESPAPAAGWPAADLYLEVKTTKWGVDAPLLGEAVVFYGFSARLLEGAKRTVLAEGDCETKNLAGQRAAKRSYEDVLANGAAMVKRQLTIAANDCLTDLSRGIFLAPADDPAASAGGAPPPAPAASTTSPTAPVLQRADPE